MDRDVLKLAGSARGDRDVVKITTGWRGPARGDRRWNSSEGTGTGEHAETEKAPKRG